MPIATGVEKVFGVKKETTWGALAGPTGAVLRRRVSCDLSLKKDTYESNEIRADYQVADMRHGVRRVEGTLDGEVSPGSYQLEMAAALRRLFTTVAAQTAVGITVAVAGSTWTLTRGAGSYIAAAGFKVGDVVRLSVGALNAANLSKNLFILALTGTVMTVIPLNGVALVAEGPIAGCTVSLIGRKTFIPLTGHTDESMTYENWFPSVTQSERFVGVKMRGMEISLPPTGMSNIKFDLFGRDMSSAAAAYFTTPTALGVSGVLAAVNGAVMVNGAAVALLTGLSLKLDNGLSGDPVVGSNLLPAIFQGRARVSGQMTVYFEDATYRNIFDQETEVSIAAAFATSVSATADFVALSMPRIKAGGADKDDGEKGLVQTIPFTALLPLTGGDGFANEQSTLSIQDSLAA